MSMKEQIRMAQKKYYEKPGIKEKKNEQRRDRYKKNKGKINEKNRIYRSKNKDKEKIWNKKKYEKNKEKWKKHVKTYYYSNFERIRPSARKRVNKNRKEEREIIVYAYSNGNMCCQGLDESGCKYNCGKTGVNIRLLQLDHINGGGRTHAKKVGGGIHIYHDLIKNNFPDGYRILCANCNIEHAIMKKQFDCRYNNNSP